MSSRCREAFAARSVMRCAARGLTLVLCCQLLLYPLLLSRPTFAAPPVPAGKTPPSKNTPGKAAPGPSSNGSPPAFQPLPGKAAADSVTKSHPPAVPPASPLIGPPPLPAPVLPPPAPRRVALVGALSGAMQAQAAHVDVDAAALARPLPALWRGLAYPASEAASGANETETASASLLNRIRRASGANLVRISPLAAPAVTALAPDGTPIVHWESVDALVQRAGEAGQDVVFAIQPPADWPASSWNALIGGALRRYRSHAAITRWELACDAASAPDRYPAFVRLARSLVPGKPLGLNIMAGNVGEGVRRTAAVCAQDRLALDSLAWRLPDSGSQATEAIRRVRLALAGFPALKGALLLPTLALPAANLDVSSVSGESDEANAAARLTATYARLLEAAAPDAPNPLLGVLVDAGENSFAAVQDSRDAAGETARMEMWSALALLNRMAGTRLRSQSDDADIGCLSARAQARTLVLLWRENAAPRGPAAPARIGADANAFVLARLHHLAPSANGGWRVTHYAPASYPDIAGAPAGLQTTAAPASAAFPLPAAVSDVAGGGNFLPGELELPVLLAPGEMCLLEVAPAAPVLSDLQMSLQTTSSALRGGDAVEIILTAHNASAKPRMLDVTLSASHADMLPQALTRVSLGALAPNTTRAYRFALRAPILGADANAWLDAQAGDNRASLLLPVLPALEAALDTPRVDVEAESGAGTARVRLVNRSQNLLPVRLRALNGAVTSLTLPPNGKAQIARVACDPPAREPGVYPAALRVFAGERVLRTLHPLVGVPFACDYAVHRPIIEGNLNEWAEAQPLGMGRAEQAHSRSGKRWGGPEDISAYAYTRWDEQNFYFACAVTDDVFYQPFGAADLERGDSVMFGIAVHGESNGRLAEAPSVGAGKPNAPAGCLVFGMALLRDGKGNLKSTLVNLTGGSEGHRVPVGVKDAQIAIRREGNRVFYEAAIPWPRLLSAPPHIWQTLDLAIMVNDNDGKNGGREWGAMEWGAGLAEGRRPALFPALRLVK